MKLKKIQHFWNKDLLYKMQIKLSIIITDAMIITKKAFSLETFNYVVELQVIKYFQMMFLV